MVCNACTCSWEIVHREVGGILIPHCNALSSLAYKRREGSLVEGLPILRVKGIPLRSRIIISRVLLCSLLLHLLVKFGAPQPWRQGSVRVRVLLLLLLLRHCVCWVLVTV